MIYIIIFGIAFIWWEEITTPILKILKDRAESKSANTKAEKIALVKNLSDDPKDIEKFITENADILSDKTIKSLVSRIETIKTDRIVDDSFRVRFDALEETESEEVKSAQRAR